MTEFFSIRDGQTREEVIRKYIKDDDDPAARQFTIVLKGSSPFGGGAQGKDRRSGASCWRTSKKAGKPSCGAST